MNKMRFLPIVILLLQPSAQATNLHVGDVFGVEYVLKTDINHGYNDEKLKEPSSYSIKYGKEIFFTNNFSLTSYVGWQQQQHKIMYSDTEFGIKTFNNKQPFVQFNPSYQIIDKIKFGLTLKTFTKPYKITENELSHSNIGTNVRFQSFYSDQYEFLFFYDQTIGTTDKKLNFLGFGIQYIW